MPKYKFGKQTEILSFQEIQDKVQAAAHSLTVEAICFFWLLYYVGCRKSEAYERLCSDCQVTESHFIIDLHKRKKGSAEVPPIELPRWFPGVEIIVEWWQLAQLRRSKRKLFEKTKKKERTTEYKRGVWLFPHIQSTWAKEIVKKVLGQKYYPHFLRLNRISELCSNPEANIEMIKSWSGIKSIRVIEAYLGASRKEQKKSTDWMAKQISPEQQNRIQ